MIRPEERVAIVGMSGLLPGASDLAAFWSNVRSGRDCSSDPPPGRWPIEPRKLLDPRPVAPDRVPSLRGYYLIATLASGDRGDGSRRPPLDEFDAVFHVALHIGNQAWRNAKTEPVDRERCGVIFGNIALPTEKMNAITMEVFGPQLGLFHPK